MVFFGRTRSWINGFLNEKGVWMIDFEKKEELEQLVLETNNELKCGILKGR